MWVVKGKEEEEGWKVKGRYGASRRNIALGRPRSQDWACGPSAF